jgi:hypothetical protein
MTVAVSASNGPPTNTLISEPRDAQACDGWCRCAGGAGDAASADRVRAEAVAREHLGRSAFEIAYSDGRAQPQYGVEEREATAAPA